MTEYPTSQEGPQPVASGGGTDEAGHGKAPIAATEAVRTHAPGTGAEPGGSAAAASDARAARSAAGAGGSAGLPRPRR
ncbi:serine/threonine protein phosphatase, partial [Streptomyces nojiriensis]